MTVYVYVKAINLLTMVIFINYWLLVAWAL